MGIIGVDLDETSFDLIGPFFEWHNKRHGTTLSRADVVRYDLPGLIGCSADELQKRFEEFNTTNLISLQPMPGAREVLQRLAEIYNIVAISSRPVNLRDTTLQSIERTFPEVFSELYLTGQSFDTKIRHGRTKGTLCRDIGVDYMVEDSLEHAREIRTASPRTQVLLYDYNGMHLWNQLGPLEIMPEGVRRVYTWEEISVLLEG